MNSQMIRCSSLVIGHFLIASTRSSSAASNMLWSADSGKIALNILRTFVVIFAGYPSSGDLAELHAAEMWPGSAQFSVLGPAGAPGGSEAPANIGGLSISASTRH